MKLEQSFRKVSMEIETIIIYEYCNGHKEEDTFLYDAGKLKEQASKWFHDCLSRGESLLSIKVLHPTIKGMFIKIEKNEKK